jgi:hypothetical protein
MYGRRIKWISLLLLVTLVIGIGTSVLACSDDDHPSSTDAPAHCVVHCGCHTLAVLPSFTQPVWSAAVCTLLLADAPIKLPLFAASIFQPPKA